MNASKSFFVEDFGEFYLRLVVRYFQEMSKVKVLRTSFVPEIIFGQ